MTGFGEARRQTDTASAAVEIRTVNNRYFKFAIKCPDGYASLEGEIERIVRERISRGTVSVVLRFRQLESVRSATLDLRVLESYWKDVVRVSEAWQVPLPGDVTGLLGLPDVVRETEETQVDPTVHWPMIRETLEAALGSLQSFRTTEGAAMAADLRSQAVVLDDRLSRVVEQAPRVVDQYRRRMHERVGEVLAAAGVRLEPADLLREVALFADRCDVNEEIARLRSHLAQFESFLAEKTSQGRKLEFLVQEIFREVNTIGSKANDVGIAHDVVDMKAAVEKIREVLQNVE